MSMTGRTGKDHFVQSPTPSSQEAATSVEIASPSPLSQAARVAATQASTPAQTRGREGATAATATDGSARSTKCSTAARAKPAGNTRLAQRVAQALVMQSAASSSAIRLPSYTAWHTPARRGGIPKTSEKHESTRPRPAATPSKRKTSCGRLASRAPTLRSHPSSFSWRAIHAAHTRTVTASAVQRAHGMRCTAETPSINSPNHPLAVSKAMQSARAAAASIEPGPVDDCF